MKTGMIIGVVWLGSLVILYPMECLIRAGIIGMIYLIMWAWCFDWRGDR